MTTVNRGNVVSHSNRKECEAAFRRSVNKVTTQRSPWMGLVFRIEGNNILLDRTMCEFPHDKISDCIDHLRRDLQEFISVTKLSSAPLPPADPFAQAAPLDEPFEGEQSVAEVDPTTEHPQGPVSSEEPPQVVEGKLEEEDEEEECDDDEEAIDEEDFDDDEFDEDFDDDADEEDEDEEFDD